VAVAQQTPSVDPQTTEGEIRGVQIGVLGPLTIGGTASRAPRRDRVVLEVLVVRAGNVVSAEQMADALWQEELPASWAKVVQGCIVRLRKMLGVAAIETTPRGYRLGVPADALDSLRFERLLGRARERLTLDEPDRAAYLLEEGLALWRGPALDELENWEPGRLAASRLDELRLDAEELILEAALRAGRHRDVLGTAQARVEESPLRERRWALLALARYQSGQQADALRTLSEVRSLLAAELGSEPGPDLLALEDAIRRQDPALVASAALPEPRPTCPYRGLVPYDVADADDFYGRGSDVAVCRERLDAVGAVTVIGPSGSGKSSLVRAGLAAGLLHEGRRVIVVTPGAHPLDTLAGLPKAGPPPVLVVDQCEEAVGLSADQGEQARFFAALAGYAARAPLVLAVRADRLGDLTSNPDFTRLVERSLYLLNPMGTQDLLEAIEGPARSAGLRLETGLVELLVHEIEGEPGALPLLSHALRATWEHREGNTLTVAGYQATGGVRGAVAQSAEAVYKTVPPDQRTALRDLLLRLVAPNPEGDPMRSRLPRRLIEGSPYHEELIETLVAARLVTSDDGVIELAHEALVRAWPRLHDWLDEDAEGLRILRHLVVAADTWESMGRPDSELYRGLRLSRALSWQAESDPQLRPSESRFLDASRSLAESEERRAAEQVREQRRVNRRLRVLLTGVGLLGAGALIAGVLAVNQARRADEQSRDATAQRDQAVAQALAAASSSVTETDPVLAIALAAEANKATPNPPLQATASLAEARLAFDRKPIQLKGEPLTGAARSLAFSPDGTLLAGAAGRHGAILWELPTGTSADFELEGAGPVAAVAFNADGSVLATAGPAGVKLWDTKTGEPVETQLRAPQDETVTLAFDNSGSLLFTGGPRGVVLWDVRTGLPKPRQPDGAEHAATSVAISPDGARLAAARRSRAADLWDAVSGRRIARDLGAAGDVAKVAFTPSGLLVTTSTNSAASALRLWHPKDGHFLASPLRGRLDAGQTYLLAISPRGSVAATAAGDNLVRLWDWTTGRPIGNRLEGHSFDIADIAFSSDGRLFATAGYLGSVLLWGTEPDAFTSRTVAGTGVEFSPDGKILATVGSFGSSGLRLWKAATGELINRPSAWSRGVEAVAFSPDGAHLAVANRDGITLADPTTGEPEDTSLVSDEPATRVAFSPDGRFLAAGRGHRVTVWELRTQRQVGELVIGGDTAQLTAMAFSPQADVLATAAESDNGSVRLWTPRSGEPFGVPIHADRRWVESLAFSRDGRLATGGADGTVRLWDTASGAQMQRLDAHTGIVYLVKFSPDGRLLATGAQDATRLWNAVTGDPVGGPLPGSLFSGDALAFNPRRAQVAVADYFSDSRVQLWDWDADHACEFAAAYVARKKVESYLPDGASTRCDYRQ
jgi:WD40 repeat protein/DNA-binding SARP family transcriptional activator